MDYRTFINRSAAQQGCPARIRVTTGEGVVVDISYLFDLTESAFFFGVVDGPCQPFFTS